MFFPRFALRQAERFMLFGLFSFSHNYSYLALYPLHSSLTRMQYFTRCSAADFHKSPNKSSTNNRKVCFFSHELIINAYQVL